MELTNSIGLIPGDAIAEVPIKNRKARLRQHPCITDVHLKRAEKKTYITRGECANTPKHDPLRMLM